MKILCYMNHFHKQESHKRDILLVLLKEITFIWENQ